MSLFDKIHTEVNPETSHSRTHTQPPAPCHLLYLFPSLAEGVHNGPTVLPPLGSSLKTRPTCPPRSQLPPLSLSLSCGPILQTVNTSHIPRVGRVPGCDPRRSNVRWQLNPLGCPERRNGHHEPALETRKRLPKVFFCSLNLVNLAFCPSPCTGG